MYIQINILETRILPLTMSDRLRRNYLNSENEILFDLILSELLSWKAVSTVRGAIGRY